MSNSFNIKLTKNTKVQHKNTRTQGDHGIFSAVRIAIGILRGNTMGNGFDIPYVIAKAREQAGTTELGYLANIEHGDILVVFVLK